MAVTHMYGNCLLKALNGGINLAGTTPSVKVMLCTSAYTPNQDTHIVKSDVTGEVTGTGYVAGGATLTGVAVTYNGTVSPNLVSVTANAVSWANSSITARYAVIYDANSNNLIAYVDFVSDYTSSNGTFQITWDSNGIFQIQVPV